MNTPSRPSDAHSGTTGSATDDTGPAAPDPDVPGADGSDVTDGSGEREPPGDAGGDEYVPL